MRRLAPILILLLLLPISLAVGDISERLEAALCNIYGMLKSLLPVILIVAIVFAALVMVVGQLLGAEMRAKANSWAQNIVIYAILAVIIIVVVPYLIKLFVPEMDLDATCSAAANTTTG